MVNRQLLTSKTLKNSQDIKPNRTCNHAKEVEANCKKAFALCKQPDSPCKSFNGTWPSGTDWYDCVEWLRVKCYERHAMDDMDNDIGSDEEDEFNADEETSIDNDATSNKKPKKRSKPNDNDEKLMNPMKNLPMLKTLIVM